MIHTADPAAFFTPLDRINERWHELNAHPDWLFYGKDYPPQKELLAQFIRLVAKHPKTTFIGAHFDNNAEDLATVAKWLDEYPNLYVNISARISELGRQPYTARKFFLKYQDRVMFGTDTPCNREAYRIYYRFLETDDEYFDSAPSHHLAGLLDDLRRVSAQGRAGEDLLKRTPSESCSSGRRPRAGNVRPSAAKVLKVPPTDDFEITGDGSSPAWQKAAWEPLNKRPGDGPAHAVAVQNALFAQRACTC